MNELLTLAEVQKLLRISRSKVYELAHSSGFPTLKIGRSIRVPKTALEEWIKSQRTDA